MPTISDRPTPESVARARDEQQRERLAFEQETGIALTDDGRPLGIMMANFMAAAVYGARGEWRRKH